MPDLRAPSAGIASAPRLPLRAVLRDTGTDAVRGIALVNLCFLLLTVGDVATVWALPVAGVVGAMLGPRLDRRAHGRGARLAPRR